MGETFQGELFRVEKLTGFSFANGDFEKFLRDKISRVA